MVFGEVHRRLRRPKLTTEVGLVVACLPSRGINFTVNALKTVDTAFSIAITTPGCDHFAAKSPKLSMRLFSTAKDMRGRVICGDGRWRRGDVPEMRRNRAVEQTVGF